MSHEIELKLALPERALPRLRRHPLVAGAEKLGRAATLVNTYYDTPALDLKAHRVGLRTRRQGRQWLQTVKCAAESAGGLAQRPEWEEPYGGAFDFSAIDDPAVAKLLAEHTPALRPVFTTRFRRDTRRHTTATGATILLMLDTGAIEVDGRSTPICELELELERGSPLDLLELAGTLARTLPLAPSDVSKAERGYRLFLGQAAEPARTGPSPVSRRQRPLEAFRSLAFDGLRQWQANASGAAERHEPEFIHQLRVSQRRLRSLVRLFAPLLPGEFVAAWQERLRDNANRFGDARDLDVMCEELLAPLADDPAHAGDPGLEHLLARAREARRQAREAADHALDAAEQGRLVLAFTTDLYRLPAAAPVDAAGLEDFARRRLARLRKRARARFEAAAELTPAQLHALRIALKRLRYGADFFAPLFRPKAMARYLEALTRAQNTLGFLNDVDVARARLARWAAEDASLADAAALVGRWHAPRYARRRRRVLQEVEPLLWGKTPWGKAGSPRHRPATAAG